MDKKWNLQDIRPSDTKRAPKGSVSMKRPDVSTNRLSDNQTSATLRNHKRSGRKFNLFIPIVVVLLLFVGGFTFAFLTSGAEVAVYPKHREPTVNGVFEAKKQPTSKELPYEMLTLEASGEREVTASGQETVQTPATGKILISNTTSNSERLIKNTRFESPEGLVFRITESVVVPSAREDGTPGQVTADVFADAVGDSYNLSSGTNFTVPGFKESNLDALYTGITGVNQANFTGGYDGPQFIIDDEQLSSATESLRSELREALTNRLVNEKPANFILFDSSVTFNYQNLPPEEIGDGKVKIKEKAILNAPLFNNADLAQNIAVSVVPGYEDAPVRLEDEKSLSFQYATTTIDLPNDESISFNLVGKPRLVWVYDEAQLKTDLAGGSKTALTTVLGGYPAIEKATVKIRPFWSRSFPEAINKITITEIVE